MPDALVYSSRASEALTDTELDMILLRSRVLNASRGLTGALLKRGDVIVQYLEGEPAALERTFEAIARSPMHHAIEVHARAVDVPRVFATWHMGFRDFQSRHDRDQSTAQWRALLPDRDDTRDNPALRHLMRCWSEFEAHA